MGNSAHSLTTATLAGFISQTFVVVTHTFIYEHSQTPRGVRACLTVLVELAASHSRTLLVLVCGILRILIIFANVAVLALFQLVRFAFQDNFSLFSCLPHLPRHYPLSPPSGSSLCLAVMSGPSPEDRAIDVATEDWGKLVVLYNQFFALVIRQF